MIINSLSKVKSLAGKRVLLRVDFNVPLQEGKIKDDYRIVAGLETIKFLLAKKARVIIISHLGEAKGKIDPVFSLRPVAQRLRSLLAVAVKFLSNSDPITALSAVKKMANGDIIFLENLRFNPGEISNDSRFAKSLAELGDIYVNDAFSVCHRDQASVSAVKKYLPSYAGLLLEKEVLALNKILQPHKPLVVIMGGAKIATKAPLIFKLYSQAAQILIGGALATTFFKFLGLEVGKSYCDEKLEPQLKKLFKDKKYLNKIILPPDVVVKSTSGRIRVTAPADVKKNESILDIGPKTIGIFAAYIKKAATLVWNGPMGKFEEKPFQQGSLSLARLVATRSGGPAYGLVGGGETIEVLKLTKMEEYIDFISTAGGAMLSYLGGAKMPGLSKIIVNKSKAK
jgi:3-phosphoglycerate kinase